MRKTSARSTGAAPPSSLNETLPKGGEHRSLRRKRETHERLLRAAFVLIAERGADAVAIKEVTQAADVGFGSFYNHFESKDAIHAAMLRTVFDGFGGALDRITSDIDDPAHKVALSARHAIAAAEREPLWGQLLLREWYRPQAFSLGLGGRLLRDIVAGLARKRFTVLDPLMGLAMAGGTIVAAVGLQLALRGEGAQLIQQAGLSASALDERTAMTVLQGLGLPAAEARKIASRALPALDWKPTFRSAESDLTARALIEEG